MSPPKQARPTHRPSCVSHPCSDRLDFAPALPPAPAPAPAPAHGAFTCGTCGQPFATQFDLIFHQPTCAGTSAGQAAATAAADAERRRQRAEADAEAEAAGAATAAAREVDDLEAIAEAAQAKLRALKNEVEKIHEQYRIQEARATGRGAFHGERGEGKFALNVMRAKLLEKEKEFKEAMTEAKEATALAAAKTAEVLPAAKKDAAKQAF